MVFHGHWLAYFDDAMTRFIDWLGFPPKETFAGTFDVVVVRAAIEWQGPAGFDDDISIAVVPTRLGNSSFDLSFTATVAERPVCKGMVTYVSVVPGTATPRPIPGAIRLKLELAPTG